MPEALYKDSKVNRMLLKLEDSMFGRWYPWPNLKAKPYRLDWAEDIGPEESVPIPILGLEYTLGFYFPTTIIDLGNIIELDIAWKNASGTPLSYISLLLSCPSLSALGRQNAKPSTHTYSSWQHPIHPRRHRP